MADFRYTTCALCGQNEGSLLVKTSDPFLDRPEQFEVIRCNQCGLVRTRNLPQPDELGEWYQAHYGHFHEEPQEKSSASTAPPKKKRGLAKKLGLSFLVSQLRINYNKFAVSTIPVKGKILEVGCGIGKVILPLKELGADVVGIEPSASLAEQARESGLEVFCSLFEDFIWDGEKFDQIVFSYTLEQIEDPVAALKKAHSLLKADGTLHILCPNLNSINRYMFGRNWFCWHLPYHKYFFSADTMNKVLSEAGFKARQQKSDFRVDEIVESFRIAWHRIIHRREPGFPTRGHIFLMLFSGVFFFPFKFFGLGNLLHVVAKPEASPNDS